MRVLLLSNPESSHTIKWIRALANNDVEVYLLSLNPLNKNFLSELQNIRHKNIGLNRKFVSQTPGSFSKIVYLKIFPQIKKVIKEFKPDIIHSHYASSYGVLGALSGFHPFVLSVWGSDVYRFPHKSFLHKALIKFSLRKADVILSTSEAMVSVVRKYTGKHVDVTPFGIDMELFRAYQDSSSRKEIVIGTVKNLKKIYGIDVLINAFKTVVERNPDKKLKLLIIGEGPDRKRLEDLTQNLGLENNVRFEGQVTPDKVPVFLNQMDIFSALSIYDESFGVSLLEAGSCQKPSVVSDVPGFREIIKDGETGFIVPRNDPEATTEKLNELVNDQGKCKKLGENARIHVEKNYSLQSSVERMLDIYKKAIK